MTAVKIKRAYAKPDASDGVRILIDRLWPRGMTKEKLEIKEWMKDIAPSVGLIKWFGHELKKWPEFQKKYKAELKDKNDLIKRLKQISKKNILTLIYSAKDEKHNNAIVLLKVLQKRAVSSARGER